MNFESDLNNIMPKPVPSGRTGQNTFVGKLLRYFAFLPLGIS
jgi:hypothetical protein